MKRAAKAIAVLTILVLAIVCLRTSPPQALSSGRILSDLPGPTVDFGLIKAGRAYTRAFRVSLDGARIDILRGVTTTCGCLAGSLDLQDTSQGGGLDVRLTLTTNERGGQISEEWWLITNDGRRLKGIATARVARAPVLIPPVMIIDNGEVFDRSFRQTCELFVPSELGPLSVTATSASREITVSLVRKSNLTNDSEVWTIEVSGHSMDDRSFMVAGARLIVATELAEFSIPLRVYIGRQDLSCAIPQDIILIQGRREYTIPLPHNGILSSMHALKVKCSDSILYDVNLDSSNNLHVAMRSDIPINSDIDVIFELGDEAMLGRLHFLPKPD